MSTDKEQPIEPSAEGQSAGTSSQSAQGGSSVPQSGRRQALKSLARELTNEELENKGVQKLILGELEAMDEHCTVLNTYRDKYHESDKQVAVYQEKQKAHTAIDVAFGIGTAGGGSLLGMQAWTWTEHHALGVWITACGVVFVIGAVLLKYIKR